MNWVNLLLLSIFLSWQSVAFADGDADLIPELKDIEKIANEQEAAIRAQSDALLKAQKEKEAAEKAAALALEASKSPAKAVEITPPAPVVEKPKPVVKKVTPPPTPKVDPWLAQDRRYSYP